MNPRVQNPPILWERLISGGSAGKNPPVNAGELGPFSGSDRCPGGRNDNPLQYSCLGNPMDRGSWWATVFEVAKRVRHSLATECTHTHGTSDLVKLRHRTGLGGDRG